MEDKESKENIIEAIENYWQEAQIRAKANRKNPEIRRKEIITSAKYWLTLTSFCLVIGPVFLLSILWFSHFSVEIGIIEYFSLALIKGFWVLIVVIATPIAMIFIKRPKSLSWEMALDSLDDENVPFKNKLF